MTATMEKPKRRRAKLYDSPEEEQREELRELLERRAAIDKLIDRHMPKKMGRPTKLDAEMRVRILQSLELGCNFTTTAHHCGIDETTLARWRKNDEDFALDCERARATGVRRETTRLVSLSQQGSFQATKFWLQHRSDEFKPRGKDEHMDADDEYDPDETWL